MAVDDSEDNRFLIETMLDGSQIELTTVSSGGEASNLAKSHSYDLILMDIQMPVMDGIETLQKLREDDTPRNLLMISPHGWRIACNSQPMDTRRI